MTRDSESVQARDLRAARRGPPAEQGIGDRFTAPGPADAAMWSWLDHCRELARSDLEGIEDPARELAELAQGDRQLMERARRVLREALAHEPRNPVLRQMDALWRRALEKGSWTWIETAADQSPLLS